MARLHNSHSAGGRRRTSLGDAAAAGGVPRDDLGPPPAPAMTGSTADLLGVTATEEVEAAGLSLGLEAARVRR